MSSAPARSANRPRLGPNRLFFKGLVRAFAGAIIFSLPLLMTMEMWELGMLGERLRLVLLFVMSIPMLVGLSHYCGFEETFCMRDDVVDAFVAWVVGFAASAVVLLLMGVLEKGMAADEIFAIIAIQAMTGGIGALLATSQFGTPEEEEDIKRRFTRYDGEIFVMAIGAIFLALNLAPTEEMVLIAYLMTPWQSVLLAVLSLVIMHGFAHALQLSDHPPAPRDTPWWSLALRYTFPGYAVALLISLYVLWTFGRMDDTSWATRAAIVVVLGFPAAIGAAAARLVI